MARTRTSVCAANRAVMWMGCSVALLCSAWEAAPRSSLLTCPSYGNSSTSASSLSPSVASLSLFCLLSVPLFPPSLPLFSLVVVAIHTVYR